MAGRRTNLALGMLLAVVLATGGLAFGIGSGSNRWVTFAHGAAGIAIVLLAPWKRVIVGRGLRRRRSGKPGSVAFLVLLLASLMSGMGHSTGAARSFGGISAMQIHVASALAAFPLGLLHVLRRPTRIQRTDVSRRVVLRAALLTAAAVALRAFHPAALRRFSGSYERGSFDPGAMPVTQWLDDSVPRIDRAAWRLEVVDGSATRLWTYDELLGFSDRKRATIDCTGGWYATQDWEGVRVERLLPPSGRSIVFVSATGYRRRLPRSDADHLLLATRAGGRPLSAGHGGPARLVAAGRRGFWWVKWVDRIELSDVPWWRQLPFPPT